MLWGGHIPVYIYLFIQVLEIHLHDWRHIKLIYTNCRSSERDRKYWFAKDQKVIILVQTASITDHFVKLKGVWVEMQSNHESHTSSENAGFWLVESRATFSMLCFAGQHLMWMLPSKHVALIKM